MTGKGLEETMPNGLAFLDALIAYEQGELSEEDGILLFQTLIDNGLVWKLQGCYGRHAVELIRTGQCQRGSND